MSFFSFKIEGKLITDSLKKFHIYIVHKYNIQYISVGEPDVAM